MILDLIHGKDLFDEICDKGKLDEDESRMYFQQLIDTIDALHPGNIIHRDLKPENILVSTDNQIFLSDFGLAATNITKEMKLTERCGTPNYAAPEVLLGEKYNGRPVDLYSTELVLYTMLTSILPFSSDSVENVISNVLNTGLEFPDYLSAECIDLIKNLTLHDPILRFDIEKVRNHPWFTINYKTISLY